MGREMSSPSWAPKSSAAMAAARKQQPTSTASVASSTLAPANAARALLYYPSSEAPLRGGDEVGFATGLKEPAGGAADSHAGDRGEGQVDLQILAEPNLLTSDGKQASFLSGGEFPYPLVQSSTGGAPPRSGCRRCGKEKKTFPRSSIILSTRK